LSNKQDNNARKKINNHPSNKHELALDDEDESLEITMSGGPTNEQSRKKLTCKPYVTANMMRAIVGSAALPVATTMIR